MRSALLLSIRLHDERYHGAGDWPPSPARTFQALLAGAAGAGNLSREDHAALRWLEQRGAPIIATPIARRGQGFVNYVPNNDRDKAEVDQRRLNKIRVGKTTRPLLLENIGPLLYAWTFERDLEATAQAEIVCGIAEHLYQLGRGVDMAWAWAEILEEAELHDRLAGYHGTIHRPTSSGAGRPLLCPEDGTLRSLQARHEASGARFLKAQRGKATELVFSQAPPARFRMVAYDAAPTRLLFDLVTGVGAPRFARIPMTRATVLVERVRDRLSWLLDWALGDPALVERVVVGRGAGESCPCRRSAPRTSTARSAGS